MVIMTANEELSIIMETIQSILEFIESVGCDNVVACNIAKIKKCGEAFDDFGGYMAGNGSEVDLRGKTR